MDVEAMNFAARIFLERSLMTNPIKCTFVKNALGFHSSVDTWQKVDFSGQNYIKYQNFKERTDEKTEILKARLIYQSRKRGTLEIGILLSTFAAQYLHVFDIEQLKEYDKLINKPSNEWDLYYWITGAKDVPAEFDNRVMTLLKDFARNEKRELRAFQPPISK